MKYREKSNLCSKGCGRERAKNQRYCKQCRAAAERARRQNRNREFLELVAFRAKHVAAQISQFNAGAGKAAQ
jgi:hypothetical protein